VIEAEGAESRKAGENPAGFLVGTKDCRYRNYFFIFFMKMDSALSAAASARRAAASALAAAASAAFALALQDASMA